MKNKLKSLLLSLMLFAGLSATADNYAYLTITQDGANTDYTISTIDKITFDNTDMVLHMTNGNQERLPMADLQKMYFSQGATSIAKTKAESLSHISIDGNVLRVQVGQGESVTLYNIKGEQLLSTNHDTTIDLQRLPQGVYIAKMGSQTAKFITK